MPLSPNRFLIRPPCAFRGPSDLSRNKQPLVPDAIVPSYRSWSRLTEVGLIRQCVTGCGPARRAYRVNALVLLRQQGSDVLAMRGAVGAVAARPALGHDQAARLMGITGIAPGSGPGPDGYAREQEAEGEVGGRGGAARPQVSPAGEDMHPAVLDARGGALEQLLGIEVVVAPADDQGGGCDAR